MQELFLLLYYSCPSPVLFPHPALDRAYLFTVEKLPIKQYSKAYQNIQAVTLSYH